MSPWSHFCPLSSISPTLERPRPRTAECALTLPLDVLPVICLSESPESYCTSAECPGSIHTVWLSLFASHIIPKTNNLADMSMDCCLALCCRLCYFTDVTYAARSSIVCKQMYMFVSAVTQQTNDIQSIVFSFTSIISLWAICSPAYFFTGKNDETTTAPPVGSML